MIAWLWLACGQPASAPPDPSGDEVREGLVLALSGYHEAPGLDELTDRVDDLPEHLLALARDETASPMVRTRAWSLFARSPAAGPRAREAAGDPALPPTVRTKVLRGLAEAHPADAAKALAEVWCDPVRHVRTTARGLADDLERTGVEVDRPSCDTDDAM